ncbi:Uncharacterized protein HZ326_10068 [Fusarium oxysporum f. sp. albedinis]|nr:Uncharacterized protein HZ326_10068 [Fusarium oxysporum f. sp. albedinis]
MLLGLESASCRCPGPFETRELMIRTKLRNITTRYRRFLKQPKSRVSINSISSSHTSNELALQTNANNDA